VDTAPAGVDPSEAPAPLSWAEAYAAELERDKTYTGTVQEREQQVEAFLADLRATHDDKQLRAFAKQVTDKTARTPKQALEYLRDDLLAVTRVEQSQRV